MTYTPKHRGEPEIVYRVLCIERERGWGMDEWTVDLDTEEEAIEATKEYNARNIAPVAPDYYITASYIGKVVL